MSSLPSRKTLVNLNNRLSMRAPMLIGLLIALALAGALIAALLIRGGARAGAPTTELMAGAPAPDFELADVSTGRPVTLSQLRGRPVWVDFWATWCPPCKAELPRMKQMYDKYKGKGLALVGIDLQEDPNQVRDFARINGYDWTFVVDRDGKVTNRYFTAGVPSHVFIDARGVVQAVHVGDLDNGAMEQLLGKIMVNSTVSP
jgi:cytochrome c biogenesis protein CcmG/thiol:disulfide interchange protein DsbE